MLDKQKFDFKYGEIKKALKIKTLKMEMTGVEPVSKKQFPVLLLL